jgi:hypothetical protein
MYGEAVRVPAFTRGIEVLAGTAATFPILEYDSSGVRVGRWDWPPFTVRGLVEDLICHGLACLEVTEIADTYGDKRPSRFALVEVERLDIRDGVPYVDGQQRGWLERRPLGRGQVNDLVLIRHSRIGALAAGADLLRTALALEGAARRYADAPIPQIVLKNSGADLPEQTVRDLLDGFETARKTHATAYANSLVDIDTLGFDPKALQLVEARQHVALEVARLLNLDPVWLGASVSGQSLTYTNRQDLYRQLVDLSLKPLLMPVEHRLSQRDILPGGRRVRFELDTFLRGNPAERMSVWRDLLDLGLASTADIARMEPLAGGTVTDLDGGAAT